MKLFSNWDAGNDASVGIRPACPSYKPLVRGPGDEGLVVSPQLLEACS